MFPSQGRLLRSGHARRLPGALGSFAAALRGAGGLAPTGAGCHAGGAAVKKGPEMGVALIIYNWILLDNSGYDIRYSWIYIPIGYLVGGLVAMNLAFSHEYWVAIIIPIDELIFFRGVAQPPTRLGC